MFKKLKRKVSWKAKQRLAGESRYYGDGGTIHGTNVLNIEKDRDGNVVSVWFRCQALPFDQRVVHHERAAEMRRMYEGDGTLITGVEVRDAH